MKFLDQVKIYVKAGNGGDGSPSFRREKFIEYGGPDGGDGGKGGSIILKSEQNLNTLIDYRYQQHHKAERGENGMGQNKTGKSLKNAISDLNTKSKGNIKGYVLDMRNNPGGVLGAAVDVSDAFIKGKKKLVFTKGKAADAMYEFTSNNTDLANGKPIVVLINGGSASASEIVAGALQDHKRAIIMGTQSFGKGSVQTVLPITSRTAVKITTARYYTPNGRSIQAKGIEPDIIVENLELSSSLKNEILKESDLKGHLENTDNKDKGNKKKLQNEKLKNDYQLSEAINLLKGLNIISMTKN